MSFIEGFISFELHINNSVRDEYLTIKQRIAKHPLETIEHICARVLCLAHAYRDGLEFSNEPFSKDSPSLINKDVTDTVKQWIHVGKLNRPSLRHAVKHHGNAEVECYFFQNEQVEHFCHQLRGAKTNWVDNVIFWELEYDFVTRTSEIIESRNDWTLSIVENQIYLIAGNTEITGEVSGINIWDRYQSHLEIAK